MVRSFTDAELLERASKLGTFKSLPEDYFLIGIRPLKCISDSFDSKVYLFKGKDFIIKTTFTSNPGIPGLEHPINPKGTAVLASDHWNYDVWTPGLHKGKMRGLLQVAPFWMYRDNDHDDVPEEIGDLHQESNNGIDFHTCSYSNLKGSHYVGTKVGLWSEGCQVCNVVDEYYTIIDALWAQKRVSYCLLKEW